MSQKESQYKDTGLGIAYKQAPISVKFPQIADQKLKALPDKSDRVRRWVIEGMHRDGVLTKEEFEELSKNW